MSEIKLYEILKEMVECTEKGLQKTVKFFDQRFDKEARNVFHSPRTELDLLYANCQQDCMMAFMIKNDYDKYVAAAKDKFSKIPKPEEKND